MELLVPTCCRLVSRPDTECLTIVNVLPLMNVLTAEALCVLGLLRRLGKGKFSRMLYREEINMGDAMRMFAGDLQLHTAYSMWFGLSFFVFCFATKVLEVLV